MTDRRAQKGRGQRRGERPPGVPMGVHPARLISQMAAEEGKGGGTWGGCAPLDRPRDAQPEPCPGTASWWGQMGQRSSMPAPPEWESPPRPAPPRAFRVSSLNQACRASSPLVIFLLAPVPCRASFLPGYQLLLPVTVSLAQGPTKPVCQ